MEFEEITEVEFRDDNSKEPCSVSGYGDIQCKAAHDALVKASQALLPLADYIEQNYVQGVLDVESNEQEIHGYGEEE